MLAMHLSRGVLRLRICLLTASGQVSIGDVKAATKSHTRLVSIMLANNEIGTVQPIAEIGRLLKGEGILFHTDAVQAVGHIPVDVNDLQVDFLDCLRTQVQRGKRHGNFI